MQIFSHPTEEERKILPRLIIGGSTYLLSPANIDKFINLCHVEEYSNGEFIMETGKILNRLGIVISGITRVWHTENNTEKTLYFGLANTVCVSMHGFLFDFPAAENREACVPCVCSSSIEMTFAGSWKLTARFPIGFSADSCSSCTASRKSTKCYEARQRNNIRLLLNTGHTYLIKCHSSTSLPT